MTNLLQNGKDFQKWASRRSPESKKCIIEIFLILKLITGRTISTLVHGSRENEKTPNKMFFYFFTIIGVAVSSCELLFDFLHIEPLKIE